MYDVRDDHSYSAEFLSVTQRRYVWKTYKSMVCVKIEHNYSAEPPENVARDPGADYAQTEVEDSSSLHIDEGVVNDNSVEHSLASCPLDSISARNNEPENDFKDTDVIVIKPVCDELQSTSSSDHELRSTESYVEISQSKTCKGIDRHWSDIQDEMCSERTASVLYSSGTDGNLPNRRSTYIGERLYVCVNCNQGFSQQRLFTMHLQSYKGTHPFVCSICKHRYKSHIDLRKHLNIHNKHHPFVCPTCGEGFEDAGHLEVHVRTHTEERPFACPVCDQRFRLAYHLNNHIESHAAFSCAPTTRTEDRPYACPTCDKRYTTYGYLKRHILSRANKCENIGTN